MAPNSHPPEESYRDAAVDRSSPTPSSFAKLADAATSRLDGSCSAFGGPREAPNLSFPLRLMAILDDETSFGDVVSWMPDGSSFTIVDPKRFTSDHMPVIFGIRNMSSFVRKLGRFGFSRHFERETMNCDIFKHPEFRRGERDRCAAIKISAPPPSSSSTSSSAVTATALRRTASLGSAIRKTQAKQQQLTAVTPILPASRPVVRLGDPVQHHLLAAAVAENVRREQQLAASLAAGLDELLRARAILSSAARVEQLMRLEQAKALAALGGLAPLY